MTYAGSRRVQSPAWAGDRKWDRRRPEFPVFRFSNRSPRYSELTANAGEGRRTGANCSERGLGPWDTRSRRPSINRGGEICVSGNYRGLSRWALVASAAAALGER
jgi:hypothetical protein